MTKTIYNKFDKQQIANLPKEEFKGRIFTITTERDAEKAVNYLMSQPILGFDSETRPTFKRNVSHQVALLQVATYDTCFLFRLNQLGLPNSIVRLLEDTSITKVALSWKDDTHMLQLRRKYKSGKFIDIQDEVGRIGIEDHSLQKIYANLFGKMISKRQQLSNWEADILTDKQKEYAATDAWACIRLYDEYRRMNATGDYELKIVEPEEELAAENNREEMQKDDV